MEKIKDLNFLDALLPLAVVIFIIGIGVVLLNQRFQKNLFVQKLREDALKSLHQRDLLRANIHVEEQERKRIAQDLHDELGGVLSIMRMNLVLLEQQSAGGVFAGGVDGVAGVDGLAGADGVERLRAGLQNARLLSETAMASVRSISHRLMPPQLESFGLIETLESVVSQIGKTKQLLIELNVEGSLTDLSWPINIGLYRVVMELINNTIRHAGATEVRIDFLRMGEYIVCNYSDNGRGLPDGAAGLGLGHKGIEGRVSSLGGKLEMGNGVKGGFYAIIQIPIAIQ